MLSTDFPLKAVVLYDGAWAKPDGLQLTIRGFYDANVRRGHQALQHGQHDQRLPTQSDDWSPSFGGSLFAETMPATEGTAGGVQVFSVAVNDGDDDGLLDAWESAGGYNEITDGSWVPSDRRGQWAKDMFAQLDYMCSTVNRAARAHPANSRLPQPDPATGQDPLLMVQQAFACQRHQAALPDRPRDRGRNLPRRLGANPPRRQFPEDRRAWWDGRAGSRSSRCGREIRHACVAGNADGCRPRFERGQKDSYHYVLFGRSLAVAAWNTRARTLDSIVVSSGNATITTPARAPLNDRTCPTRVTISGALGVPALNGVYDVSGRCASNTSFTNRRRPGSATGAMTKPTSPDDEREPLLAVISGDISSISGYSDLGGADSAVTLGKWATNQANPRT